MHIKTLERIKQQWLFAADSMPQLICLVDSAGRLTHANRTLERWRLGEVEWVKGVDLHDVVHKRCRDGNCYLRQVWRRNAAALARDGHAECSVWDPLLERHFEIRIQMPVQDAGGDTENFFAVVVFDDVTAAKASHDQNLRAAELTQNELWRLSAQHLTIQESERRRIAADLHDGLGQTLSLVKMSIEEAARAAKSGAEGKTAAALERLGPTIKSALAELRRMSMNLRPTTLDDLGILATLSWYTREFEAACPSIKLEREINVKESDISELLKITIFRIVQEATSNALKHAEADRIKVSLELEGGSLELSIKDNGRGFDAGAAAKGRDFHHGLGLQSMKERAELSGASYEIQSAPGKGTRIRARWPSPEAVERRLAAASRSVIYLKQQHPSADPKLPERLSQCNACISRITEQ